MSNYTSYADHQAEELLGSLSDEDIQQLRGDLELLGVQGWDKWATDNRREANEYLRATANQRTKKKKWKTPDVRRWLTFAAYHQARLATSILYAASELGPGGGYRDTTAHAATVGYQVIKDGAWRWPFLDVEPPAGWPGPHVEPYYVAVGTLVPGQPPSPPEIKEGLDYT